MYLMLKAIADRHKDVIFDVFYTGANLPESSDNFLSHGYVPNLYEHLARAKIAIVHGGLTTLHEALLFEKPVLIIMDPNHPEQQNNARKIVDMGAGIAIDGRHVSKEVLEEKIAETMQITPGPFREVHARINGQEECGRNHPWPLHGSGNLNIATQHAYLRIEIPCQNPGRSPCSRSGDELHICPACGYALGFPHLVYQRQCRSRTIPSSPPGKCTG